MSRIPILLGPLLFTLAAALPAQKLHVYILAGQSNMEGHAKVETFDYIGDDKATAPLLKEMRGRDGKPRICKNVWISYRTGRNNGEGKGRLTAGYGARRDATKDGGKIGPELTFGIRMAKAHKGPVLLIKTAWGGKSLHTDFRSPSAGAYTFSEQTLDRLRRQGKDIDKLQADKKKATGRYYRLMMEHVQHVLADIKRVVPSYNAKKGYQLGGFVWFQGWNDMVDHGTYPRRDKRGGYHAYSQCMAHFIRDVRKDLAQHPGAKKLPFVIGVMGVGGKLSPKDRSYKVHSNFRAAMAAPAAMREFRGNVTAVQTAPFWSEELEAISRKLDKVRQMGRRLRNKAKNGPNRNGRMSRKQQREYLDKYRLELVGAKDLTTWKRGASNAGYHYLGCAKTMAGIGVAFAEALLTMQGTRRIR